MARAAGPAPGLGAPQGGMGGCLAAGRGFLPAVVISTALNLAKSLRAVLRACRDAPPVAFRSHSAIRAAGPPRCPAVCRRTWNPASTAAVATGGFVGFRKTSRQTFVASATCPRNNCILA